MNRLCELSTTTMASLRLLLAAAPSMGSPSSAPSGDSGSGDPETIFKVMSNQVRDSQLYTA